MGDRDKEKMGASSKTERRPISASRASMVSRTSGSNVSASKILMLKEQREQLEQAKTEKARIREENDRIKKKERELKEAEKERKRIEALERPKILAAKRENMIAERNAHRVAQAESSEKVLSEKAAEIAHKNALRASEHERYRGIVQTMCEDRPGESLKAVQGKIRELRRVFVYLDKNCDGIISADDLQKRLTAIGCKISVARAEALMMELRDTFGDLYGGCKSREHWTWAMKMHQPDAGKYIAPEWSIEGPSKNSTESIVPEKSWDNSGISRDPNNPHPSEQHLRYLQAWTQDWPFRIICPDSVDNCTKQDRQHPPHLSPRSILDAAPQNPKQEFVSTVMLTESGLMTEQDWHAHLSLTPDTNGLAWIGLRDCFFKYSVEMAQDPPLQFFTIFEFLMSDTRGQGTASLEDCMNIMIQRFGTFSDSQFVNLFGNSCDPQEQISLPVYLDKVRRLMVMKYTFPKSPSRGTTSHAGKEGSLASKSKESQHGAKVLKVLGTADTHR